jgi:hypothetical protein
VLNVAETSLWVLVKVMTNKDVPPALMVDGVNVLATNGTLAVIVSLSVALQVPAMQAVAVLVLVTVAGAEMEAVLVTWVCAKASCGMANDANKPSCSDSRANTLGMENPKRPKRLTNLASTGIRTPNSISLITTSRTSYEFCNIHALEVTYSWIFYHLPYKIKRFLSKIAVQMQI